jgi:hypothetical protein
MSPLLTGFPFAAGGASKATVTGTTGSPTVDTTSRPGKTIYKFTGSGTITIGVAGSCEYLVIGGGAVNGAGGLIYNASAVLPAGTLTVTIGAGVGMGGVSNATNNPSRLGDIVALGGGFASFTSSSGDYEVSGGSAGGYRSNTTTMSAQLSGAQGNNGGAGWPGTMGPSSWGGGGGAGGVGGSGSGSVSTGGAGGAGLANSITGSSVTYAAGAGGWGTVTVGSPNTSGGANTGSGGSVTSDGSSTNTGGSGFVVVVIG